MSAKTNPFKAKSRSLEWELKCFAGLLFVSLSMLFSLLAYIGNLSLKVTLTLYFIGFLILLPYLLRFYKRIINPMRNLVNSIEAIRLADYGMSPSVAFKEGVMAQLTNETSALLDLLQKRKARYNQQVYLIYRLIEQLELPVLVFDEHLRLSHANEAFSKWYGQPWQAAKGLSSKKIGFKVDKNSTWHFLNATANRGWQIKHSRFAQEKHVHQLLILNNINSEVSQVQQDAWQQIIRVLSHEIRNSLTPICSMTDLMLAQPDLSDNLKTPVKVIESRSTNLLQFVERYADTARPVQINKTQFGIKDLIEKILPLFTAHKVDILGEDLAIYADVVLLEQVLINLIRNAIESQQLKGSDKAVALEIENSSHQVTITIKDRGRGIANPDNLFVPFYTTKKGGQGIGLALCKKFIDLHNGSLTLTNRKSGGAVATITLPNIK